jgi:hypothetical protein
MICLVSGLFFLFSPLVCMLHCSDDLLSIWIVLLVLSPSLYVNNITTREENKKNKADTKNIITKLHNTNEGKEEEEQCRK